MSEHFVDYSEEIVKNRISDLISDAKKETEALGMEIRLVGSLGVAATTGRYPRLLRQHGINCINCVDLDLLIGLPEGVNLHQVKDCFDYLWNKGMDSEYKIPVSPINLPKEVANDPKAVLSFDWLLGRNTILYKNLNQKERALPVNFVDPFTVNIYGQEIKTLTPNSQIKFKYLFGYKNPLRLIKSTFQILPILINNLQNDKYPN